MGKTTTVATSTSVEVPSVDERELETFHLISNTVGEVLAIHVDADEAERNLRELAKGRSGEDRPRIFLHEVKALPTDQALAARKVDGD